MSNQVETRELTVDELDIVVGGTPKAVTLTHEETHASHSDAWLEHLIMNSQF